jgi:transcriptional regulator with XRE-family HTH domain
MATIPFKKLTDEWMKDPAFKAEYDALEEEFALASELIRARAAAKLSQAQVAARMGTTQSAVARLESGRTLPSLSSLQRYASAVGCGVRIALAPAARKSTRKPTQKRAQTAQKKARAGAALPLRPRPPPALVSRGLECIGRPHPQAHRARALVHLLRLLPRVVERFDRVRRAPHGRLRERRERARRARLEPSPPRPRCERRRKEHDGRERAERVYLFSLRVGERVLGNVVRAKHVGCCRAARAKRTRYDRSALYRVFIDMTDVVHIDRRRPELVLSTVQHRAEP